MMITRRTIDPEMDHKLYEIGYMLHGLEKGLIIEIRRPNWMDGSDIDDLRRELADCREEYDQLHGELRAVERERDEAMRREAATRNRFDEMRGRERNWKSECKKLRAKLERVEGLLRRSRAAMMEPHSEWKDVRENKLIVEIRRAMEADDD